jgi:hypothetical protein
MPSALFLNLTANPCGGGPGPSLLGTRETPDLNWQEEVRGLAGSVPVNALVTSNRARAAGYRYPTGRFRRRACAPPPHVGGQKIKWGADEVVQGADPLFPKRNLNFRGCAACDFSLPSA